MKTTSVILSLVFMFLLYCCETDKWEKFPLKTAHEIEACGVQSPLNQLSWLRDLIIQSYNDPNFIEMIWVKEYNKEDIFVVQYSVSSVAYYFFNCDGIRIYPNDPSITRSISGSPLDPHLLYLAEKIKH
jgi:hypothetical protein